MPMGAMEPQLFRKTATRRTASIKRTPMGPPVRCTLRMAARLMAPQVSTATTLPWGRPQTATSTRPPTGIHTRTRVADGAAVRTILRSTTVPVTRTPRNPAHRAGEGRKRVAGRRPSAAVAVAGGRGLIALVVRRAGAVVVAGVVTAEEEDFAGEHNGATEVELSFVNTRALEVFHGRIFGG